MKKGARTGKGHFHRKSEQEDQSRRVFVSTHRAEPEEEFLVEGGGVGGGGGVGAAWKFRTNP